jgi:hypothetical protein
MGKDKDFGDTLAEEVLTEVASGFLGERKEIDEQIALLDGYVAQLNQKAEQVKKKAAFVNYLLLEKHLVGQFYQSLGIDSQTFSEIPGRLLADVGIGKIPFAVGLKKRYLRLIFMAYDLLYRALTEYLTGSEVLSDYNEKSEIKADEPNFRMVMIMADLINEKIKKINYGKSPALVLRFAKSLNPQLLEKEKITGAVSPNYECTLDNALALAPLDPDCLPIEKFPELPETESARLSIIKTCEVLYPFHKTEIARRISKLREYILSIKK